jgi:hypothetical protein
MAELLRGTVTLVFTDIEGSTRLLENLGESYGEVLAEHRRLLRAAFSAHGGIEVDTQGDAFFFALARATMRYQPRLKRSERWPLIPGRQTQRCGCAWASTPASRFSPISFQSIQPHLLICSHEVRLGLLRQRSEVVGVRAPDLLRLFRLLELLERELPDRLQHGEPGFIAFDNPHQALIHQRRDSIQDIESAIVAVTHRFGSLQAPPSGEHPEAREDPLIVSVQ